MEEILTMVSFMKMEMLFKIQQMQIADYFKNPTKEMKMQVASTSFLIMIKDMMDDNVSKEEIKEKITNSEKISEILDFKKN